MYLHNYSRIFNTQFVPVCTSRHKKSSTFNSLTTLYKGENDVVRRTYVEEKNFKKRRRRGLKQALGPGRRLHHYSSHTLFMSFTVTVVKLEWGHEKKRLRPSLLFGA